jgi:hypothetical protein
MNGPIAQIVALSCYANEYLGKGHVPAFFPSNSTCQFCDRIRFTETKRRLFGGSKETVVATTPDDWFRALPRRRALAVRPICQPGRDPTISERMSSGFAGGGRIWLMETQRSDGTSEYWSGDWRVWNTEAPEKRIWDVSYRLSDTAPTRPKVRRSLSAVKDDLRAALRAIHGFSERHTRGDFSGRFADALDALNDPSTVRGYHEDIAVPGQLDPDADSMLKAVMSAWVFGGMGSWNDMGFQGTIQSQYETVSDRLFDLLHESIEVAANSAVAARQASTD